MSRVEGAGFRVEVYSVDLQPSLAASHVSTSDTPVCLLCGGQPDFHLSTIFRHQLTRCIRSPSDGCIVQSHPDGRYLSLMRDVDPPVLGLGQR